MTIPQAFDIALQHHRAGRLSEAEAIYRQIVAREPNHADSLHNLGVIANQAGRHDIAVEMIRRAIALVPNEPVFHCSLGIAYRKTGRLDDAIAAYRRAVELKPDFAGGHSNLGNALRDQGRLDEALAAYRRALALKPDHAEAHNNLGAALRDQGQLDEAISEYRLAVQLKPDYAEAHNNLGAALRDRGKLDEAIAAYHRALAARPDYAEAHNNLGAALGEQGRTDDALAACRRALQFRPNYAEAHSNLGNALKDRGQLNAAVDAYRQAIRVNPNFAQAHNNLGVALKDLGRVDESIAACRRAIEIKPDYANARSNLLFFLHYVPDFDAGELFREHCRWDEVIARPLRKFITPHDNERDPGRRLRVGYVSPDFREHSVAFFFESLLANHDRNHVESICYAEFPFSDPFTARLQQHAGRWRNIMGQPDAQVADLIRRDQIDILVDLAGHTAHDRLPVFARKPAPIQVTWLGYMDTTGLSAMDYRLTDVHADPPAVKQTLLSAEASADGWKPSLHAATDPFHSEQLIRLPEIFACFRPAEDSPPVNPLPALANGYVTFASFHTLAKLNDHLLEWWAGILARVPDSRLLIAAAGLGETSCRQRLSEFFASNGIEPARLKFTGRQSLKQYLALHSEVDLLLDSHPFSGHTIGCHALWMGVPVVTLAGERHCSRMVASVLTNLGLKDLIARSPGEYVEIATKLAGDLSRLSELRSTLRERMQASPLMNGPRFARNVEEAYREMWQAWCAAGGRSDAIPSHSQEVEFTEDRAENHFHLGNTLREQGQLDEAIAAYRRALQLKADYAEVHNNLGGVLKERGQLDEAVAAYERALQFNPDSAVCHYNLGTALREQGRLDEALAECRRAVQLDPDYAEGHHSLGCVLQDGGHLDEAIAAYSRALQLKPDFAEVQSALGSALREKGQLDDAIAAYRRAITSKPDIADAHLGLCNTLRDAGKLDEAAAACRKAIEIKPDYADAYSNLAVVLEEQGQLDEAIAAARQAMALKPDHKDAHSNFIFMLDLLESTDPKQQQEERRRWYEQHGQKFAAQCRPHENDPDPERKLRVGYVSADFRRHSAYYIFAPVLCGHDRTGFEIFCYSGVKREDDATARLRQATENWRSTVRMSDEAVAEQIRRDRVDILVDLSGHSSGNRLLVFARKPAPVQVTAWGHATGTGMKTMDYFFADPLVAPTQQRALYAEEVIDLPCVLCYEPPEYLPAVSALPALQGNPLTYGCVNRLEKITDRMIGLWGRILQEAPGARLLVKDKFNAAGQRQRFLRRLHEFGRIDAGRVLLVGRSLHAEHLKIFHQIDVGLDPFPTGGGVSTAEALWMGVPVVTLLGATVPSRISMSLLSLIEMHDWVAHTDDDYVRIALQAGRDLARVAKLRRDLRERLRGSPFGDVQRYTRAVEQAYRQMWRVWCGSPS